MLERYEGWADRHWKWLVVAAWIALAAYFLGSKIATIHAFGFSDTDDNLRLVQVRDWVAGQGWYDLRQHRINPPDGLLDLNEVRHRHDLSADGRGRPRGRRHQPGH